jgi:hypothetical protein
MNRRVRGSPIEDLKLGRKGGKGGSQSIYAYGPVTGLVSSYTPLRTCVSIRNHLTSRPHDRARDTSVVISRMRLYASIKEHEGGPE